MEREEALSKIMSENKKYIKIGKDLLKQNEKILAENKEIRKVMKNG